MLLFRFSALTYNGHRIHYDLPYATGEEGYPGLVIHGPLLALLALDLPRVHAPDATLTSFEYRLVRPAFAPATVVSVGQPGPRRHGHTDRQRSWRGTVADRHGRPRVSDSDGGWPGGQGAPRDGAEH